MIEKIVFKKSSRREFFQKCGKAGLVIGGGLTFKILLDGCAHITFKEEEPVIYPHVGRPDQRKIQPPDNGCYIGFHIDHREGDSWLEEIGQEPKIIVPSFDVMTPEFKGRKWGSVQNLPEHSMLSDRFITFLFKDISYYLFGNTNLGSLVNDRLFKCNRRPKKLPKSPF